MDSRRSFGHLLQVTFELCITASILIDSFVFFSGPKKAVELLVKNGANIHHANRYGHPAFTYAVKHGNLFVKY